MAIEELILIADAGLPGASAVAEEALERVSNADADPRILLAVIHTAYRGHLDLVLGAL